MEREGNKGREVRKEGSRGKGREGEGWGEGQKGRKREKE